MGMNIKEVSKLLANRINQEHYVFSWIKKVYELGYSNGKKKSNPSATIDLNKSVNAMKSETLDTIISFMENMYDEKDQLFHIDHEITLLKEKLNKKAPLIKEVP